MSTQNMMPPTMMPPYSRAVPVLQVADVEKSLRWYADVLGFSGDPFPEKPPYSFAILRRGQAEIMLQCANEADTARRQAAPDAVFVWSVYLRIMSTTILQVSAAVATRTKLVRGPQRMPYGLVEVEIVDPDGHHVCLGGEAPAE